MIHVMALAHHAHPLKLVSHLLSLSIISEGAVNIHLHVRSLIASLEE